MVKVTVKGKGLATGRATGRAEAHRLDTGIRVSSGADIAVKGLSDRSKGGIWILKSRAKPSYATVDFDSYNEALAYARKLAAMAPSRPYKRFHGTAAPTWCVTVRQPTRTDRAVYEYFPADIGYIGFKME